MPEVKRIQGRENHEVLARRHAVCRVQREVQGGTLVNDWFVPEHDIEEYHRIHGWARPPEYKHWFESEKDAKMMYCVCGLGLRVPTHENVN